MWNKVIVLEKEYKICEYQNRKGKPQYHLFWRYKILPLWFTVKEYDGYNWFHIKCSNYEKALECIAQQIYKDDAVLDKVYKRVKCTTIKGKV